MKLEKKRLRKPACNPPISQEKAGFITYSTYESRVVDGFKNHELPIESSNLHRYGDYGPGATSLWLPYHFHSPFSLMMVIPNGIIPKFPVSNPAR